MLVPAVACAVRARELDEPHASLDEPACEQALRTEGPRLRRLCVESVKFARRVGLAFQSHEFRHRGLHAIGEFVVADRTFERVEFSEARHNSAIQLPHQRELVVLQLGARLGRRDVCDGVRARLEDRSLVARRQEAAVEIVQPARRDEPAVQHDEARQLGILAAETVACPRAHARPPLQPAARVQEIIRVRVLGKFTRHRTHNREVIHARRDMREEFTHRRAALAIFLKFPRRAERAAVVVELRRLHFHPERLAVFRGQPRLRVERVHLRRPAIHVEEDDVLRLRRKMRLPRRERIQRIDRITRANASAKRLVGHQRRERDRTEAIRAARKHLAPRERAWDEVSTVVHGQLR